MTRPLALDTSVAVPLLVRGHVAHAAVVRWRSGAPVCLPAHASAETYSVLTRLPAGLTVTPDDAARLLEDLGPVVVPADHIMRTVPRVLARVGIAGGAVYDALVALAAIEHGLVLATRDARALPTYRAVGAEVEVAADPAG